MSRNNCAIGKDYKPASYKGVAFVCQDVDYEGGRRVAEAEYPFANHTNAQDMGIKIKNFKLTAIFREDDHVGDARALFAACESPGPGLLVHPTYGGVTVICKSAKVKDDVETDQGETKAELEFVEYNAVGLFGALTSLFGVSSSGANAASQAGFTTSYRPIQVSPPWKQDVVQRAQDLVSIAETHYTRLLKPDSPAVNWRSSLKMKEVVQDDGLAVEAKRVDDALTEATTGISILTEDVTYKVRAFKQLANAAATPSTNLPAGVAEDSEEAVLSRTRFLAAIGLASTAMAAPYENVTQVLKAMKDVNVLLQDEAKAAYDICDNVLFLELRTYMINFTKMMYDRAYRLPPLVALDFMGSVYPLKAAYAMYGDAKRHRELERRNVLGTADARFFGVVVGVGQ
jgi:prophage DNA circulation protein